MHLAKLILAAAALGSLVVALVCPMADLAAPRGAMGALRGWLAMLAASPFLATHAWTRWIQTTWASYLVCAFLLTQLATPPGGRAEYVTSALLVGLGVSDILLSPVSTPRARQWLARLVPVAGLLGALAGLRSVEIDEPALSAEWPTGHANAPTMQAWLASRPRVLPGAESDAALLFLDYQCPPCAIVHREYGHRLKPAGRVITVDFPLDRECNPYAKVTVHELACELAVLVRLTRERDPSLADRRAAELLDTGASPRYVWSKLAQLGVHDPHAQPYARALSGIRQDVELGRRAGVDATPTFVIRGHRIRGTLPPQVFDRAVRILDALHPRPVGRIAPAAPPAGTPRWSALPGRISDAGPCRHRL